jgi:inhibitor of apoptosis domain-containing protein/C3HC4-type zinc finger (RING finger) protein
MDVCGRYQRTPFFIRDFLKLFNIHEKLMPRFPEMISYDKRVSSYSQEFIASVPVFHTEISECGFYSTGVNDYVICFYCGIGLYSFEISDDIWIEHSLHSPECLIVKLNANIINERKKVFNFESNSIVTSWMADEISSNLLELGFSYAEIKDLYYTRFKNVKKEFASLNEALKILRNVVPEQPINNPCVVCLSREVSVTYLKCGHTAVCSICAPSLLKCPIGNEEIIACVKVYIN